MSHVDPARCAALVALALASCGGAAAGPVQSLGADGTGTAAVGEFVAKPTGELFVVDPSEGGRASELRIEEMLQGRLVDVYDRTPDGEERLWFRDFLVGEHVQSDGVSQRVELDPVTQRTSLVIFEENDPDISGDAFDTHLLEAAEGARPLFAKALDDLPPHSIVPRNGAVMLRFSDVVDTSTVRAESVRVYVGSPPVEPHEARVFADANHGALLSEEGEAVFRPTRVIIDMTISELEAQEAEPPLSPNALGLPPSHLPQESNLLLRLPTQLHPASGHFARLENPTGHGLSASLEWNGPIDANVGSVDVVRAMRTGGDADLNRGYLVDLERPVIVGEQVLRVLSAADDAEAGGTPGLAFRVELAFESIPCAQRPRPGDVLQLGTRRFSVEEDGAPPVAGVVSGLRVRSLTGPTSAAALVGAGSLLAVYDPSLGHRSECFVQFLPAPLIPPADGVEPHVQVRAKFSEPMDPDSLTAFDSWLVASTDEEPAPDEVVAATLTASPDLRTFTWAPLVPLPHETGVAERYTLRTNEGARPIADLAGNPLVHDLGRILMRVRKTAGQQQTGSYALRFGSQDEDGNGDYDELGDLITSRPEIRGQFLYDLEAREIRPRPVSRFTGVIDAAQLVVGHMGPFPPGLQTPLSPLGSRLLSVWRYVDFGFTLTDESLYNLDVEGLHWAPLDGHVVADTYESFKMRLGHSHRFPDEYVEVALGNVPYWGSGLKPGGWDSVGANLVEDENGAMVTVHPKELGYRIDPSKLWAADSGTLLMPYPMNDDADPTDDVAYTWRDTSILARGGPNGGGVEPGILVNVGLLNTSDIGLPYGTDEIPTIGLPLLMEYSCYPSDTGLGLNAFTVSIATNLLPKPFFRLFSTGGVNSSGNVVVKDPDLQWKPTGGFNPSNGGGKTPPGDPSLYWGAADFLIRVSRVHTIWIDAGDPVQWERAAIEPASAAQPSGTSLVLEYRGATSVGETVSGSSLDAGTYDPYGDPRLLGGWGDVLHPVEYLDDVAGWRPSLDALDGARYVQVRATFVGNRLSKEVPTLSAVGVSYSK